jgi:hypothetical protein
MEVAMSNKLLLAGIAGVLVCQAVAAGCGDDEVTAPVCPAVQGKGLQFVLHADDWTTNVSLSEFPPGDSTTSFSGRVDIPDTIIAVDPGDTLSIRLVFADPLVISSTVPSYIAMSLTGGNQGGCAGASPYLAVEDGGGWDLTATNGGVRGPVCSGSTVHGFWFNMVAGAIVEGARLTCLTATFVVPAKLGGIGDIAPGQNLPVDSFSWDTELDGDRTSDPFPVQVQ